MGAAGGMDAGMGMGMMHPPSSGSPMPHDDPHHVGGSGNGMSKMTMPMHMTFFWGTHIQILFSGWPGDRGIGVYLLALLFVFAIAALVECLSSLSRRLSTAAAGDGPRASTGLLLTALHAARETLAYLVMLAVMSFNVGVLIAAIAGHALGFLVAGSGLFRVARDHEKAHGVAAQPHSHVMPTSKR